MDVRAQDRMGVSIGYLCMLYIGSISASPTACLLRGHARAGTQNDRLGEAVMFEYLHVHTRATDVPSATPR